MHWFISLQCDSRKVNHDIRRQAQEMVDRMGFDDFIEASAKTNQKVEDIFEKAVSQVSATIWLYVFIQ